MTKNIVWLHSHFLFWMGGTKFIYEVVKRIQAKRKYRVMVIVENASELVVKQYQTLGTPLVSLNSLTSTSPWYWLALPWLVKRRTAQVAEIVKQQGWSKRDTTIISSMFPMNVIANQLGNKHVQLCYEPFAFFYDTDFIKTFSFAKRVFIHILRFLYVSLDKQAVTASDTVLTLNRVTQTAIQETYEVDSKLVYAGVDLQRFKPYVPSALKKRYAAHPVAVHSTDYSPVKGTDRVIKAMQLVVKKVPKAKLLITSTIANPEAERQLRQLATSLRISRNVEFLGFLPIEELPHYYSLAQVLVQGSNSAKSGTTSMALPVKEAMCCGTPAIRPDVGGDDVVDGVSGYLVDPADTQVLADRMITLLKNPVLAKQMGQVARQTISGKYTWEKTTERILKHV